MAIATLLLLGVSGAAAQSLGDYARAVRKDKDKAEPSSASRHYDNDNLPTGQTLSVVGPPPAADANAAQAGTRNRVLAKAAAADPAAAAAERQKTAEDWKIRSTSRRKSSTPLNHDLDLAQREYRLRVATQYDSAGQPHPKRGPVGQGERTVQEPTPKPSRKRLRPPSRN